MTFGIGRDCAETGGAMNVLMPSAGKRYLHIQYIQAAKGVKKVVTTEMSAMAPAIHAANICYRVPRIKDPGYLEAILWICDREKIDLIIPLMDLDIVKFSRNRKIFAERGIRLLLHPAETVEMSIDKMATYDHLTRNGIPTVATLPAPRWEEAVDVLRFPLIMKPVHVDLKASAQYAIEMIPNAKALKYILGEIPSLENYVFQECMTGTELTVDFFCDQEGKVISVVPGERLSALSKAFAKDGGAIDQGKVFHDPDIEGLVRRLAEKTRFWGAANFQGYRDRKGVVKIVEINPRFSGATVMTRGAGMDYFQWSIDLVSGKQISKPLEDYRDVCMSSWLNPIFFTEVKISPVPEQKVS